MNKSDLLDELRLEVGRAYDYALNHEDFIGRVSRAIFDGAMKNIVVIVYKADAEGQVSPVHLYGTKESLGKECMFGLGFSGMCGMKSSVFLKEGKKQTILMPVTNKNRLSYIFSLRISTDLYAITDQDLLFTEELANFIEAKGKLL
ncbi:hypothetical protein JSY36_09435 [Bacillus sp. H-16]|uniref:hypothetical protein n=1 Tax=Alteribacter salitolerans TaxID=2912333 RepID=UPI001964B2E2|nr:hypothetical protein [Alteribacter salitolerans]MBM7095977.1 hypothetical protein [Alteribacter salitolerans]